MSFFAVRALTDCRRVGRWALWVGVVLALSLSGCDRAQRMLGLQEKCKTVHSIGQVPLTEIEPLARIVQLQERPVRAIWARGQVGGPPEEANLAGEGDWEVVALLEFSEADTNKLTDTGNGEVVELEVPAAPWLAKELGVPMPELPKPGECRDVTMKVSGLGYDATPFVQYFLKPVAFVKVPESPYFVLWLSTRPPAKDDGRSL